MENATFLLLCFPCFSPQSLDFSQDEGSELWKMLICGICSWCIKISERMFYKYDFLIDSGRKDTEKGSSAKAAKIPSNSSHGFLFICFGFVRSV